MATLVVDWDVEASLHVVSRNAQVSCKENIMSSYNLRTAKKAILFFQSGVSGSYNHYHNGQCKVVVSNDG